MPTASTPGPPYTITGLQSGTPYRVRVSAGNSTGASAPSAWVETTTASGGTVTPATFTATEDATTYLPNPGIGWQETDTVRADTPTQTTPYRRAIGEFFWNALNPSQGTYDWSRIDTFLAACASAGQLGSFRVMSMRGESFGGHQTPAWVTAIDSGAVGGSGFGGAYPATSPNYENATYQTHWATFCEAMRVRYDGDPRIAYVDISGYGDFGEWTFLGNHAFLNTPSGPGTDTMGHARRFLTELYVGGTRTDHRRLAPGNGSTQTGVSYSFPGWQSTQLVMPHGGIRHHTAWVARDFPNVGHRRDNLGTYTSGALNWDANSVTALGGEFASGATANDYINGSQARRWKTAPIWFEQAGNNSNWANQNATMRDSHGTGVHDNWTNTRNLTELTNLMLRAGYRLTTPRVLAASSAPRGSSVPVDVDVVNRGYAPPYPRQGQVFELRVALRSGSTLSAVTTIASDPLAWLPNDDVALTPPTHTRTGTLAVPSGLTPGLYTVAVAVHDTTLGTPILLAQTGRHAGTGYYDMGTVTIT